MTTALRSLGVLACLVATVARADPVPVRQPEGASHGFLVVSDVASGKHVGEGDLTQSPERGAIASRMLLRFSDGSVYDETLRFSQRRMFRLLWYHLVQRGPSFKTALDVEFDRSRRYRARRKAGPDADEDTASGTVDVPDDCSNGLMTLLLKNIRGNTTTHLLAFTPKPRVLELHLTAEGSDEFSLLEAQRTATRYLVEPKLTGVTGVVAKVVGKDPQPVRIWIADGKPPTFALFEGPLEPDGRNWRIELVAPRWKR